MYCYSAASAGTTDALLWPPSPATRSSRRRGGRARLSPTARDVQRHVDDVRRLGDVPRLADRRAPARAPAARRAGGELAPRLLGDRVCRHRLRRHDAVERVYGGEEEEDVDPAIMLGFMIVNIFVDFFMCAPFVRHVVRRRRRRRFPTEVSLAQVQASSAQPGSPECRVTPYSRAGRRRRGGRRRRHRAQRGKELNLVSAYAHVFADTLRTLTVLTCAVPYASPSISPATADAVGALVVSHHPRRRPHLGYETVCQLRAFLPSARAARTRPSRSIRVSGTAPADAV